MSGRYDNLFVPRAGDKKARMLECLDARKLKGLSAPFQGLSVPAC